MEKRGGDKGIFKKGMKAIGGHKKKTPKRNGTLPDRTHEEVWKYQKEQGRK